MNVKQLKEAIANLPDHMQVFVDERTTDFKYGLVNSAQVKTIDFMEYPEGEPLSSEEVIVLSEE